MQLDLRFLVFRVSLGAYLAFYFSQLFLWAPQLYSVSGYLPPGIAESRTLFSPMAFAFVSPKVAQALSLAGLLGALLFACGIFRRVGALFCFFPLWIFFHRNPLADSPEQAFLLWFLLASLLVPTGEPGSLKPSTRKEWQMPAELWFAANILLAAGYFYAAQTKIFLGEASWWNGSAMGYVLTESAPRRLWYGTAFDNLSPSVVAALTYGVLFLQAFSLPMIFHRRLQAVWWWLMAGLHVGAALFLDVAMISIGMLVCQLFVFPELSCQGKRGANKK